MFKSRKLLNIWSFYGNFQNKEKTLKIEIFTKPKPKKACDILSSTQPEWNAEIFQNLFFLSMVSCNVFITTQESWKEF